VSIWGFLFKSVVFYESIQSFSKSLVDSPAGGPRKSVSIAWQGLILLGSDLTILERGCVAVCDCTSAHNCLFNKYYCSHTLWALM